MRTKKKKLIVLPRKEKENKNNKNVRKYFLLPPRERTKNQTAEKFKKNM